MKNSTFELPFKIGAPSMVFGDDLLQNVRLLAAIVDHIEIVLFYTTTLNNFPTLSEIKALRKLGGDENVSFSVHLPASLEIACRERKKREKSVQLAIDLIHIMDELNPMYHILHIPYTTPTLTPVPGLYFNAEHRDKFIDWTRRATQCLKNIQGRTGQNHKLLIENINYSPIFLETFWNLGLCGFCLDMGHLMLGGESVTEVTKQFIPVTSEVHLHGVIGCQEHLSLAVLPANRVSKWLKLLLEAAYGGVVNLEVFSQADLTASMRMLADLIPINCNDRVDVNG
ncbi:MAG: sugar phosphate isomerase/epimerase [Deltaproteobacteria bacterium]|jgi:sugar phosphate isomerase/epimerase|nr:sugar phosphate isomerase/epimerase [Deltaproteobacteria bacterium]